ncbi:hypothetical protein LINPERHAP2_LOCUS33795 [Linum perenne]
MVDDRQLENGNFKAGGYKDLERWLHTQIPGCKLKEDPHIKSRHRYFKEKFCAQLELKNYASGFGWDEIRQCLTMDDTTWVGYVKVIVIVLICINVALSISSHDVCFLS